MTEPDDIRVLVVDDHPAVRAAVSQLLSEQDDMTVVGECADGSEVVAAAAQLRPDVVVMDLAMPVMDGLAATAALRAAQPAARVVMLTGEGGSARHRAAAAGAHAVVSKGTRSGVLLSCLRAVVTNFRSCSSCL